MMKNEELNELVRKSKHEGRNGNAKVGVLFKIKAFQICPSTGSTVMVLTWFPGYDEKKR